MGNRSSARKGNRRQTRCGKSQTSQNAKSQREIANFAKCEIANRAVWEIASRRKEGGEGLMDDTARLRYPWWSEPSWPALTPEHHYAWLRVFERGVLTNGPELRALEDELARWLDVGVDRTVIGVSSGTAAIHAMLQVIGVGPGVEVIVPAVTFMATALPILQLGATPRIVDVDPTYLTISPGAISAAVNENTRAVIVVDLDGCPVDVAALDVPDHVWVLEDACPAIASSIHGRRCGSDAGMVTYSFNQTKIVPAGEGGALCCSMGDVGTAVRALTTFGEMDDGRRGRGRWRDSVLLGHNWKLPETSAALARASLERLPRLITRARSNVAILNAALGDATWIAPPVDPPDSNVVRHKYRIRLSDPVRDAAEELLEDLGVPVMRPEPLPLHRHGALVGRVRVDPVPVSESILDRTVVIGSREQPIWHAHPDEVARWAEGLERAAQEGVAA